MPYSHLMDEKEFRTALAALGMNQVEFAEFIGLDGRTVRRYALGETPVPRGTALLIKLLIKRPELIDVVAGLK